MHARFLVVFFVLILAFAPDPARSDCTPTNDLVPAASRVTTVQGGLVYDLTNDVLKTCDGTNWTTVGGFGTEADTLATVTGRGASTTTSITGASFIPNSATVPASGIYLPAANTLGLATAGAERMRLDSTGTLALGSSSTETSARLNVNGSIMSWDGASSVRKYSNLAYFANPAASLTGTLKITMPKTWSSTMGHTLISGYNYAGGNGGGGAWRVVVGGYNYTGAFWVNTSAQILGRAPFGQVRLAHDGTNNVILLGTTATTWAYPIIEVTEFLAGYGSIGGWGSGWSISIIAAETGITAINSPSVQSVPSAYGTGNTIAKFTATDTLGNSSITDNGSTVAISAAVTGTSFAGSGAGLTALNASNLGSGTVPAARLGSGTASGTTFLRGDGTWATPAGDGQGITALTGDVTATGSGSVATTVANSAITSAKILDGTIATDDLADDAVSYSKIQNVTSGKMLGRAGAGAGVVEEITLGAGLSLSGSTLSAASDDASGTLCGWTYAYFNGATWSYTNHSNCKGQSTQSSCPSGYTWKQITTGTISSNYMYANVCFKN